MSQDKEPKIEKGIPIPHTRNRGYYADLAKKLEIGDSVLYETSAEVHGLRQAALNAGKRVVTRKMADGYRAWCVGDKEERE